MTHRPAHLPLQAQSANDLVAVNTAALSAGAVTPSLPTIDTGQSITLTSHPSGGTSPYTYNWFYTTVGSNSATTCGTAGWTSAATTTNTYTPSPTSNTYYCYTLGDSSTGTPAAAHSLRTTLWLSTPLRCPQVQSPHHCLQSIQVNQSHSHPTHQEERHLTLTTGSTPQWDQTAQPPAELQVGHPRQRQRTPTHHPRPRTHITATHWVTHRPAHLPLQHSLRTTLWLSTPLRCPQVQSPHHCLQSIQVNQSHSHPTHQEERHLTLTTGSTPQWDQTAQPPAELQVGHPRQRQRTPTHHPRPRTHITATHWVTHRPAHLHVQATVCERPCGCQFPTDDINLPCDKDDRCGTVGSVHQLHIGRDDTLSVVIFGKLNVGNHNNRQLDKVRKHRNLQCDRVRSR